ncbi:MAG TPA: transposase family protein [Steroidobacteraceae bacterium]
MSLRRGIPPKASRAQERWSMDFVHDLLIDGRASRVLTVVDQWSRWSPILEVGSSMTGQAVAEALGRVIPQMAFPPRSPWIMAPSSPRMHWMSGRIGVA